MNSRIRVVRSTVSGGCGRQEVRAAEPLFVAAIQRSFPPNKKGGSSCVCLCLWVGSVLGTAQCNAMRCYATPLFNQSITQSTRQTTVCCVLVVDYD